MMKAALPVVLFLIVLSSPARVFGEQIVNSGRSLRALSTDESEDEGVSSIGVAGFPATDDVLDQILATLDPAAGPDPFVDDIPAESPMDTSETDEPSEAPLVDPTPAEAPDTTDGGEEPSVELDVPPVETPVEGPEEEIITDEPISDEPTSEGPISEEPISDEPISEVPTSEEPSELPAETPITDDFDIPMDDGPALPPLDDFPTEEPSTAEGPSTTEEPTEGPTAEGPVVEPPTADGPEVVSEEKDEIEIELTFDDLDFDELTSDPAAQEAFESSLVDQIATAAGVDADSVEIVELRAGSVIAVTKVTVPAGEGENFTELAGDPANLFSDDFKDNYGEATVKVVSTTTAEEGDETNEEEMDDSIVAKDSAVQSRGVWGLLAAMALTLIVA